MSWIEVNKWEGVSFVPSIFVLEFRSSSSQSVVSLSGRRRPIDGDRP